MLCSKLCSDVSVKCCCLLKVQAEAPGPGLPYYRRLVDRKTHPKFYCTSPPPIFTGFTGSLAYVSSVKKVHACSLRAPASPLRHTSFGYPKFSLPSMFWVQPQQQSNPRQIVRPS